MLAVHIVEFIVLSISLLESSFGRLNDVLDPRAWPRRHLRARDRPSVTRQNRHRQPGPEDDDGKIGMTIRDNQPTSREVFRKRWR